MTSLTIELPPDIYRSLSTEAQRQGKPAQLLAQELLVGQLQGAVPAEVPLAIQLLPEIRALLATATTPSDHAPDPAAPATAIALLQSWTTATKGEEDAEDAGNWEDILRAIDANRSSSRKLFPDLEQAY